MFLDVRPRWSCFWISSFYKLLVCLIIKDVEGSPHQKLSIQRVILDLAILLGPNLDYDGNPKHFLGTCSGPTNGAKKGIRSWIHRWLHWIHSCPLGSQSSWPPWRGGKFFSERAAWQSILSHLMQCDVIKSGILKTKEARRKWYEAWAINRKTRFVKLPDNLPKWPRE